MSDQEFARKSIVSHVRFGASVGKARERELRRTTFVIFPALQFIILFSYNLLDKRVQLFTGKPSDIPTGAGALAKLPGQPS